MTALDRLRRITLFVVAESHEGAVRVTIEDDGCDGLTFFEPARIYERELLIDVDTMRPLDEVLFDNADGLLVTLQDAFANMLKHLDENRQR